jgi:plasmid stabilization system protein ParE
MPTVELAAQAGQQLAQAREWWGANRDKAPHAVDDDMSALFLLLEGRPELVGRALEQWPTVRRVHLRRIRYYAYFRIVDGGERVQIVALWHTSRSGEPTL